MPSKNKKSNLINWQDRNESNEYYRRKMEEARRKKGVMKKYFSIVIEGKRYVFNNRNDIINLINKVYKDDFKENDILVNFNM